MIKNVLFDLDGTLLNMNEKVFVKEYFSALGKKVATLGYDKDIFIENVWKGMSAMVANDGKRLNEEVFWATFSKAYGESVLKDKAALDSFYENDFDSVKEYANVSDVSRNVVKELKLQGYKLVIASNPVFPLVAQKKRLIWAGVDPDDFTYITAYENSSFSKPNVMYYKEIMSKLDISPNESIMVGNDVNEDMVAKESGLNVYLVTDCLLNKSNKDISEYNKGTLDGVLNYIATLNKR